MAGHDTTSSTIAGGLHALISHPAELDRLRSDLSLLPTAVDEMTTASVRRWPGRRLALCSRSCCRDWNPSS
jgi:hypothetical protein